MENESQECPQCKNTYKNSKSLQTHINKIHNKKEHICSACKINFTSNANLVRHQTTCKIFIQQNKKQEEELKENNKKSELELTTKFLKEKIEDKDKQLCDKDKQLCDKDKQIELLLEQLKEKDQQMFDYINKNELSKSSIYKDMYKDTIDAKNKLFEVSNRSNQIQTSMMNQVNSNNNSFNVIVQHQSDLELARKLIPISNETLTNACLSVLNQYTDNYNNTIYLC